VDNISQVQPRYMLIWGVLAGLMLAKVGLAFLGLPKTFTIVVLCTLALVKASLVAAYYMHLRFEPRRLVFVVLAPLPLVLILIVTVMLDRF
jgi:cytochrome c oxidase subunit IV